MWQILERNPRALLWALLLHLAVVVLLFSNMDWTLRDRRLGATENLIQANLTLTPELSDRVAELRDPEGFRAAQEAERQRAEDARREAAAAAQRAADAEAERRRQAELAAKRQAEETARREAEREARRQADLAARRQAEETARREAEQAAAAKREAEQRARREAEQAAAARREAEERARREAEQAAAARREAEETAKREAEERAKREAEERAKREAEERAKREAEEAAQRAAQAQAREAAQAARVQRLANEWVPRIQGRVAQFWVRPQGLAVQASPLVALKLSPGGIVVPESVRIIESSGYPAFDTAVIRAIRDASPLPVPDGEDFKVFEEFNFRFTP